jgi:glyoxylase-like metal-dependent hydrolase (beta-lactamase superfamily II)
MRRLAVLVILLFTPAPARTEGRPQPPKSLRLYVFDCGVLNIGAAGPQRYHIPSESVAEPKMSVPCFLIAHPKGTLMWDVGVIPDDIVEGRTIPGVTPSAAATVTRTLRSQLQTIGYTPRDIDYVSVSHAHNDHSANLNQFAAATWLVRPAERDFMWAPNNTRVIPGFYTEMKKAKAIAIDTDEYDVFGDGKVVLKYAPGHTPGHQVLILNLGTTGRIMLSGDLYHYPPERTLHAAPPDNESDPQQSAASRARIEEYLAATKTALWIEHDFTANAKLKKAPAFYE